MFGVSVQDADVVPGVVRVGRVSPGVDVAGCRGCVPQAVRVTGTPVRTRILGTKKCPARRANARGADRHPLEASMIRQRTCSFDGCARKHFGRGWCELHYGRWKRTGTPYLVDRAARNVAAFWAHVDKQGSAPHLGSCWLWTGSLLNGGYPDWSVQKRHVGAHRFAYALIIGPIPHGLELDHLCRVITCVNPEHLEPVTSAENLRRQGAAVTVCRNGHLYTSETTYIDPRGKRGCRVCRRQAVARSYARKRVA